jgi:hypothetical protein
MPWSHILMSSKLNARILFQNNSNISNIKLGM